MDLVEIEATIGQETYAQLRKSGNDAPGSIRLDSAATGNPIAQRELGTAYHHGNGVLQSFEEAMKWWKLAAEQEDAKAQANLGDAYYHGEGVKKNLQESIKWWKLAAC